MKYKIIKKDDKYFVKIKWLFWWVDAYAITGEQAKFFTLEQAHDACKFWAYIRNKPMLEVDFDT